MCCVIFNENRSRERETVMISGDVDGDGGSLKFHLENDNRIMLWVFGKNSFKVITNIPRASIQIAQLVTLGWENLLC